ncbi:MAG: sigma 54-interacting transcriptional regulator [Candidatus Babeliales bacterium]|nr:sigma 54-interacting transcriptional regulator [Candidatus Babeliales bacterium]
MIDLFEIIIFTISSSLFLLIAIVLSFSVKTYFLRILIPQGLKAKKIRKPWLFLLGILVGSMFGDAAWMVKLVRELWIPSINYNFVTFMIRVAWAFLIIQYQALSLFIESLTEKKFTIRTSQKLLLCIGSCISLFFFYLAFFDTSFANEIEREMARGEHCSIFTEIWMMRHVVYYLFNLLIIPSFYIAVKKLRSAPMPKILRKQLRTLIQFLIVPYICIEFLQAANFMFKALDSYAYAIVSTSTMLLTYAIYYCLKRVMGLRFLNFNNPQTERSLNFVDDFKTVFEQLSYTSSTQELTHIIQTFFKHAFDIPLRKTMIYIRPIADADGCHTDLNETQILIERAMSGHDGTVCNFINKHKILMYDEIDFNNFYDEDHAFGLVLEFLDAAHADIFLPLYEKQKIIGYIVVERNARAKEFNNSIERDEMLVFAGYLGNILNLLHANTSQKLVNEEKELKEELYYNQQEMKQYKESIRSFLRHQQQKEIGIIFYRNRRFVFANQAAKELIPLNVNNQEGHPITQALKKIARQTQEYKTPQTFFTKDSAGARLVLCGVPSLEQHNVIITVHRPEISDIITKQLTLLKDPSAWDYLLYLETTQAGQLINQLIPGSGEQLLNVKINLLKMALGKKAVLLKFPEADILPAVELLHHISGRETMYSAILDASEKHAEIGIKLFGVNPAFDAQPASPALFKKLDGNGTLFIKNVEMLSLETQEHLAGYILYGNYRMLKSDQNLSSNVRVICSTHEDLQSLVNNNSFSKLLLNVLQKNTLSFPSLLTIPESELHEVIMSFTEQALITQTFKNLLDLNDKERGKLILKRPESLQDLKTKVHNALIGKSKKNQIYDETHFDPAYAISDPELLDASRLGKHALRDAKTMGLLWSKFKSQNQIATFLGVNRSSVNRRCKDYNLQ